MTNTTTRSDNRWSLTFVLALMATSFSIICMRNFGVFDNEIFERLLLCFGETESTVRSGASPFASSSAAAFFCFIAFLFAELGVICGWKLSAQPRSFAFLQIFALSLLADYGSWKLLGIRLSPLTFFLSSLIGLSCGYAIRKWDWQETRARAQFYQLTLRNNELRDIRLQMVRQDEVERRLLAADLHDQVLNDLKQLRRKFENYVKQPSAEEKQAIDQLLSAAMVEIREVMDSLCPSALEHLGLSAALEDCLRRTAEKSGFKARFRGKLDESEPVNLSMVEQSLLYRLVQESLTNVVKHAEAKTVRITLERQEDTLVVLIADDGKGVDASKLRDDSRGLQYMRQRADLIGATISWRAGDADVVEKPGTVVEIRVSLAGRGSVESTYS
ncbi:MAG: hypothetical protein IAF58_05520 [Leptolyngbya sp.]|nr:hypothetical protein [Candidatus Melainabacteria bacterium]